VSFSPGPGRGASSGATSGGGGGSVGFFQAYTPAGVAPVLTPARVSPAFSDSKSVETRAEPMDSTLPAR
jgi:hypothetical protein